MAKTDEELSQELDSIFNIIIKFFSLFLICFFIAISLKWFYFPVYYSQEPITLYVEKGTTSYSLSKALEKSEDFSLSSANFRILSVLMFADKNLKAGEYTITNQTTLYGLISMLKSGDVNKYNLTIIEGWTVNDLLKALEDSRSIKPTLGLSSTNKIGVLRIGTNERNFEGLLLPDTYQYEGGTTDISIISRAHRHMQDFLNEAWNNRSADIKVETPYEALILASIVEKEALIQSEMPKIAAVYHQRLKKNWRLQADPTVNYALGGDYSHTLTREDLKYDSVFNTYMKKGLPPSPISFPSRQAINAVLHPADSNDIYFVADGKGGHVFSDNYEDHQQAVKKYRQFMRRY